MVDRKISHGKVNLVREYCGLWAFLSPVESEIQDDQQLKLSTKP